MQQLGFDWNWAQRREWINEAILPSGRANDGKPVSASAMAGVLNAINDHLGDNAEAWPSQQTIAQRLKVSEKTVQRACQALETLSLLIISARPCAKGTCNYYRIVWSELQLLSPERRAAWEAILRGQNQPAEAPDTLSRPSDTFPRAPDTLSRPSDTVSDENYKKTKLRKTTTTAPRAGTTAESLGTAQQTVVVVSLEEVVLECGVDQANYAVRTAREVLRLSDSEIEERIEAYRALPALQQRPGVLYNWLAKPRSYATRTRVEQTLTLCPGLPASVERERAELIRYGKKKGWDFQTLQRAVQQFELQKRESLSDEEK